MQLFYGIALETTLGYELAYSTTLGFDPDTCFQRLQFTDSSSYTIPIGTLSPLTTYYLYLRTICGVGDYERLEHDCTYYYVPTPRYVALSL